MAGGARPRRPSPNRRDARPSPRRALARGRVHRPRHRRSRRGVAVHDQPSVQPGQVLGQPAAGRSGPGCQARGSAPSWEPAGVRAGDRCPSPPPGPARPRPPPPPLRSDSSAGLLLRPGALASGPAGLSAHPRPRGGALRGAVGRARPQPGHRGPRPPSRLRTADGLGRRRHRRPGPSPTWVPRPAGSTLARPSGWRARAWTRPRSPPGSASPRRAWPPPAQRRQAARMSRRHHDRDPPSTSSSPVGGVLARVLPPCPR